MKSLKNVSGTTLLRLLALFCLCMGFVISGNAPKTFDEKERIAVEMKKVSKQLDVKCEYCHTDADRGLKEGDFTLLTKEGEYAHEEMFPISEKFRVECAFCHRGGSDMTAAGDQALKDIKFMNRYKKRTKRVLQCTTCHIPGQAGREFSEFTAASKKLRK